MSTVFNSTSPTQQKINVGKTYNSQVINLANGIAKRNSTAQLIEPTTHPLSIAECADASTLAVARLALVYAQNSGTQLVDDRTIDTTVDEGLQERLNHMRDILKSERHRSEREQLLTEGLNYEQTVLCRFLKVEWKIRFPRRFWCAQDTGKNMIYAALDTILGFKDARQKNDIETMASLYRQHVINCRSKDKVKYPNNGQASFFCEVGGLASLMARNSGNYLPGNKRGSPAALLRLALPGLIDVRNPYALDPVKVENYYWTDPENAKYHIYLALDTIPGFKDPRQKNDIETMAELYRQHVIDYKSTDKQKHPYNGQVSFFHEVGGLANLMASNSSNKKGSPIALLQLALPGLVDNSNPDALQTRETENSSKNAES